MSQDPKAPFWERCIDCPPLNSLDGRVGRLETAVQHIDQRIGAVELQQGKDSVLLENMQKDIRSVVQWLDGKNGADGFKQTWAVLDSKVESLRDAIKSRRSTAQNFFLGMLGFVAMGLLSVGASLIVDAIKRGAIGG